MNQTRSKPTSTAQSNLRRDNKPSTGSINAITQPCKPVLFPEFPSLQPKSAHSAQWSSIRGAGSMVGRIEAGFLRMSDKGVMSTDRIRGTNCSHSGYQFTLERNGCSRCAGIRTGRCLILLGIIVSATQGCPTKPGGTNLGALRDLCRSSQTPWPYDAYSQPFFRLVLVLSTPTSFHEESYHPAFAGFITFFA